MDNESVISNMGLSVMADPERHITDEQLDIVRDREKYKNERKTLKSYRKEISNQRRSERSDHMSVISRATSTGKFSKSNRLKSSVTSLDSASPSCIFKNSSKRSDCSSEINSPKQPISECFDYSENPNNEFIRLEDVTKIVQTAVQEALTKQSPLKHDNKSINESKEYNLYVDDEFSARMKQYKNDGVQHSENFDIETASTNRKELEHWRMKLSLEEKELAQNCNTFIAVGADVIETLCDAICFDTFETKSLSNEIQKCIEEGRFNNCIRQYANMGGTDWMKNPIMSFLTTFCSITLKNHIEQKRTKYVQKGRRRTSKYDIESKNATQNNEINRPVKKGDRSDNLDVNNDVLPPYFMVPDSKGGLKPYYGVNMNKDMKCNVTEGINCESNVDNVPKTVEECYDLKVDQFDGVKRNVITPELHVRKNENKYVKKDNETDKTEYIIDISTGKKRKPLVYNASDDHLKGIGNVLSKVTPIITKMNKMVDFSNDLNNKKNNIEKFITKPKGLCV